MFNFVGGFTISGSAKFIADFFALVYGMFGRTLVNTVMNIVGLVINFFVKYLWIVCKWVLAVIDGMQFIFTRLIGIDTSKTQSLGVEEILQGAQDIAAPGGQSYYDYIMKVFRAVAVVAIILMIVFTIIAMVIQEYNLALSGDQKMDNSKGKFFRILLSNLMIIVLMPLIFYTIIAGSSAILTSFYRALGKGSDVSVAGNVLAAASYDANRYRSYANANKRIPITISVYSMENAFGASLSDEELQKSVNDPETQAKLRAIGGAFANNSFLPFEKSTLCESGIWTSYQNYSLTYNNTVYNDLGDYFENFICTREQYYVMADFVDYCQLHNIKYYVKAMSEPDISWKYVDGITADMANIAADEDGSAIGDITLKVKYRDAAEINLENYAGAAAADDGTYELQITTKLDYTSPISDALSTASKLLGIDEESSEFNAMERDDSGDFTNLVSWSTEKVLLRWSNGDSFSLKSPNNWNFADQIILYEYFRFEADGVSSNNTLQNYTINDFKKGVEVDARELTYRNFNSNTGTYSDEKKMYCVKLNSTYYRVYESDAFFDDYGHPYYMLDAVEPRENYFTNKIVKITKTGTDKIHLSSGFDINKSSDWSVTDQVLVYEYFKDLSLSNELVRNNKFMDFLQTNNGGVSFNTFSISVDPNNPGGYGEGSSFIYINGTFYQWDSSYNRIKDNGNNKFLIPTSEANKKYFGYNLTAKDADKYGISGLSSLATTGSPSVFIDDTDAMYQRYSSMNFKLSEDFSFFNSDTWTFRDYAIIYLYINRLKADPAITVDSLKYIGLNGAYCRSGSTYYMHIKVNTTDVLINVENLSKTSELKITQTLDPAIFDDMNLGLSGVNLVTNYSADISTNRLLSAGKVSDVKTHKFEMSENFDAYDATTWTVGDYLILYLTKEGVIKTDATLLKVTGYTSLVYTINSKNYYRFGREGDLNSYFLDETKIKNLGYDINKWFSTSLLQFLIVHYYKYNSSELYYDESTFGEGRFESKDSYILNLSGDVSGTKSLQYTLARDIFDLGISLTELEKIQYTYSNPQIDPNDLLTWKHLDLMIYQRTGTIPTSGAPYTSYIYQKGSTYYFLIKDKSDPEKDIFVDISSDTLAQGVYSSGLVTTQIRSDGQRSFSSSTDFDIYYNQYLNNAAGPSSTGSKKVFYYSQNLIGSSSENAKFVENQPMTDFDMVLIKTGQKLSSTGYYIFTDCVKEGNVYYVKLGSKYYPVSSSKYDKVYFVENSLSPNPSKSAAFVSNGEHTSFVFGNEKKFDALLYAYTGSTASTTYPIYKSATNNISFINVNGTFIKYDADLISASATLQDIESTTYTEFKKLYIDYLYNNYYSQNVSEGTPVVSASYSGTFNNIGTWYSGLNVILSKKGLSISKTSSTLLMTNTGDWYLNVTGSATSVYINLSGLVEVNLIRGTSNNTIDLTAKDTDLAKWRVYNSVLSSYEGEDGEIINEYYARTAEILQNATISHSSTKNVSSSDFNGFRINVAGVQDVLKIDNTKTVAQTASYIMTQYTFARLLSNYIDPQNHTKELNIFFSHIDGKPYVLFDNGSEKYLIPYTLNIGGKTPKITDGVVYSGGTSMYGIINGTAPETMNNTTIIGTMVENKYDVGQKYTSTILKDEFGNNLTIYLMKETDNASGELYAIYGLENKAVSSNEMQYVYIVDAESDATKIKTDHTNVAGNAEYFSVYSRDMEFSNEWTMVDFVLSYYTGTTFGSYFTSYIYRYKHSTDYRYYVRNGDDFIILPKATNEKIFGYEADNLGVILPEKSSKLIDLLCGVFAGSSDPNLKFVDKRQGSSVAYSTFEQKLVENKTGEGHHIRFSENFDIRNTETWTIADYILYYVGVNDFYESGATLKIPFTYTPSFNSNGKIASNLTYFDLFMTNAYGLDYLKPGNNQIYRLEVVRDSSYNYYVKIKSEHYVKLSDYLYTNYAKMELKSPIMGDSFTIETGFTTELDAKINMLKTEYWRSSILGETPFTSKVDKGNFQTLANSHGTLGYVHYLLKQDENTGSVEFDKVIEFGSSAGNSGTFFKYNKFFELHGSSFADYVKTIKENELEIKIGQTTGYCVELNYTQMFPDLAFKDYYYFLENAEKLSETELNNVDKVVQTQIVEGTSGLRKGKVSLKLSTTFSDADRKNRTGGFLISDTSTWTVIDYIIMREYSREGVNHNKFKDMAFTELYDETYADVYIEGDVAADGNVYMLLNGNFYNLKGLLKETATDSGIFVIKSADTKSVYKKDSTAPADKIDVTTLISKNTANINNYNVRVLYGTVELSINPSFTGSVQYNREKENISYQELNNDGTKSNVTVFRYVNTDIADENFRIDVTKFAKYSSETLIKKVSWVEKLMTDMQVYYPDLNWGTLIATDGWLDTLGDFTSAYTNGLFTGGDNSSNTTAAGLVLSEFFMSVAKESNNGYADYEYSCLFDEETVRTLMLSLAGEENYNALVLEAKVFMDYFNTSFAPIIDDFAKEFGESIGENSLRLNAYKSYLATLLLSSDVGEYLYTLATRIYSEYTIGEYLACAGNDYSGFYGYANLLKDEEGNLIDSYNYGKFKDLVIYENKYCGNNNPTFTFNVKKAFNRYATLDKDDDDTKLNGLTLAYYISDTGRYSGLVSTLLELMDAEYESIYEHGYQITEHGAVIDKNFEEIASYENDVHVYCYMLHVYWSIKNSIKGKAEPSYLQSYRDYLFDNLSRWSIYSDANIDGADQYFESAVSDKGKMELYRTLTFANAVRLYCPSLTVGGNNDDGILEKLLAVIDAYAKIFTKPGTTTTIPLTNAFDMFSSNPQARKAVEYIREYSIIIYFIMGFSQDSGYEILDMIKKEIDKYMKADLSVETSWKTVKEYSKNLDIVISELQAVREILPGEKTEGGSDRQLWGSTTTSYSNDQIDQILTTFQDLKYTLNQYITLQERIDRVNKRAITFTLAQYGSQYVSAGYQFSVRNKDYTFRSTVDPSRIAEYVYGGAFLESVGVGAQYTSPDFTGMVYASKVYDNEDKLLKTHLDSWPALRLFATNLADKTAELYFLTNLKDLDVGVINAVKLDSTLKKVTFGDTNSGSTLASMLVKFIQSQFSSRGMNDMYQRLTASGDAFTNLSMYLFSNEIDANDLKGMTFEQYKRIAMEQVIANEQNGEESAEERANRYMTLFNLLGAQFDLKANGKHIPRVVREGELRVGNYALTNIEAELRASNSTIEIIKTMSGLENRPTAEVLTREYGGTRVSEYFDEAYGDTFIMCTYKNGMYYPILASGSKSCSSTNYAKYYAEDGSGFLDTKFTSDYLGNGAYVIVAKGVITPDGNPTAIRKYNNPIEITSKVLSKSRTETYNPVTYYRTNIGGNFGSGDDLVNASRSVGRVTTKNYTKYVYGTNFTSGVGSSVTYTGRNNLKTVVLSDFKVNFVQTKVEYLTGQADDYGGISVIDEFSFFYVFSGQTWILLMLSFITIIPVMINAMGGVISRIFDLIILFILSPLVISTNSLFANGKNDIYKKWKKNVEQVLWSALGYIIGFSSFTILVPIINGVNTYVDVGTYSAIVSIGGLGKFVSYPMLNGLVRALWMITAVSVLDRIPKLLLPIITANNGDVASPHPGLGGGGKPFTQKVKDVKKDVKEVVDKMRSVVSGKALIGMVEDMKETALGMVPGYELMKSAKEKIIDPIKDAGHKAKVEAESKLIESLLIANGVNPKVAKAAGAAVKNIENQRKEAKDKIKKQREEARKEFKQTFDQ